MGKRKLYMEVKITSTPKMLLMTETVSGKRNNNLNRSKYSPLLHISYLLVKNTAVQRYPFTQTSYFLYIFSVFLIKYFPKDIIAFVQPQELFQM